MTISKDFSIHMKITFMHILTESSFVQSRLVSIINVLNEAKFSRISKLQDSPLHAKLCAAKRNILLFKYSVFGLVASVRTNGVIG